MIYVTSSLATAVVLCFNTGFYSEGMLVMTRKEVMLDYIKSWLLLDLVASFPYSWVVDGCLTENCGNVYTSP